MRLTTWSARVVACALLAASPASAVDPPALERVGPRAAAGYLSRPRDLSSPRPVTVYLHGLCGQPVNGCPQFRDGVVERSWLFCPRAPTTCDGGGNAWNHSPAAATAAITRVADEAERLAPGAVDRATPGVLVGFSQGAYVVEHLLRASPGRWRAAAFIAADIRWTRAQFERAGVRRVVLAASRGDMMRPVLRETARRLAAEGFPVRFVDLGPGGHTYVPAAASEGWREALAWLEEADAA